MRGDCLQVALLRRGFKDVRGVEAALPMKAASEAKLARLG